MTQIATTKTVPADAVGVGRSGQISQRVDFAGKPFGVDVKLAQGGRNYQAGVVTRAFAKEKDAMAFAEKVNTGKAGKWYTDKGAHSAIVVPVWPTPEKGQPWPWETPAGKAALEAAHAGRKAPAKRTRKPAAPKAPAASA